MGRKRILVTGLVLVILGVLVYLQFRTWKNFDWATFWSYRPGLLHLLTGISLIYVTYFLRAVRWKIFLRPVRKEASMLGLFPPTLIGFAGLVLLGRPGELIRPYLIARREKLSFSSQLAVWTVERIFDIGAFTVLLVCSLLLAHRQLKVLPHIRTFEIIGVLLVCFVAGISELALQVRRNPRAVANWIERRLRFLPTHLGAKVAERIQAFAQGLDTIQDRPSLAQLIGLSLLMWFLIALAYVEVAHSYGVSILAHIGVAHVVLLMGSSMVGSLAQLPAIGGGSQLATTSVLYSVFSLSQELSVSCGILLWLVTFVAVVPAGLVLAHRERLSLRKLSQETQHEEEVGLLSTDHPSV